MNRLRIRHTGQRIRVIGTNAHENPFVSLDAPSEREGKKCHYKRMCFPICTIDSPKRIAAHHDFGDAGNRRAIFIADIANYAPG
jgi:hypothetical protein